MTREEVAAVFARALARIAPEADLASVGPRDDLREALDLDSMDFLNLLVGVHEQTGIEIPEADAPKLATLEGAAAYLAAWEPRRG